MFKKAEKMREDSAKIDELYKLACSDKSVIKLNFNQMIDVLAYKLGTDTDYIKTTDIVGTLLVNLVIKSCPEIKTSCSESTLNLFEDSPNCILQYSDLKTKERKSLIRELNSKYGKDSFKMTEMPKNGFILSLQNGILFSKSLFFKEILPELKVVYDEILTEQKASQAHPT